MQAHLANGGVSFWTWSYTIGITEEGGQPPATFRSSLTMHAAPSPLNESWANTQVQPPPAFTSAHHEHSSSVLHCGFLCTCGLHHQAARAGPEPWMQLNLSVCLSVYLSIYLSICLSIYLLTILYLLIYLPNFLYLLT